ncbi:MAG: DUF362 domain-containing protein [Deltaproteobacteria bacterium]|nr:DUF362 domain-containing protein [Deltaproteobacteria bacterium]
MAAVRSLVAVVKTRPESVLEDYGRVMRLARVEEAISPAGDTLLKLNLSWTQYFPACSTEPWQLEGVVRGLLESGYARERLFPVENKTVVTHPRRGCKNNLWEPILERYGLAFQALPEVEWTVHEFRSPLLKLNDIFPEGIEIPKMYVGKSVIHFPTVKTHGHSITTGAIKNAFGGLLKEVRHYAHKYIHEVMVDLVMMQKEIHPGVFAVMDGTVCGDGAGPRTMYPRVKNYVLASADSVAIDAIAAQMMGFAPLEIPYLRLCHERGLGVADPREIEVVGEDVSNVDFGFQTKKSFVIWGDQMLRQGPLRFLERVALHSPLVVWAPMASNVYHDFLWYPTIGRQRIREFRKTEWGQLFERYRSRGTLGGPLAEPPFAQRAAGS